jgi:hypothetical protein
LLRHFAIIFAVFRQIFRQIAIIERHYCQADAISWCRQLSSILIFAMPITPLA